MSGRSWLFLVPMVLAVGCGSGTSDKPPPPQGNVFDAPPALDAPPLPDAGQPDVGAISADWDAPAIDLPPLPPDTAPTDVATADGPTADAAGSGPDSGAAGPDLPAPRPVTVRFTGAVATVAGTPLGFDSTVRTAPVSGSFTYDLRTPDQTPADPKRGRFEHGATATFTFTVMGHTVTGSSWAIVQTEDLDPDTFRYLDGPQGDSVPRVMKLDGTPAPALKLFIAISGGADLLHGDALPDPFPTIDIAHTPHTLSLMDQGGTLLMQLDALTSP